MIWKFESSIGRLWIKQLQDGRFGFIFNDVVWESCDTPEAEVDNIFMHVTGCSEWDAANIEAPHDLVEWIKVL